MAVCFPVLSEATYRRLHDSGACLSCFDNSLGYADLPERLGLFHYEHPDDLYIPEPYGRWGTPQRPLHIDELPDEIREMIRRARFDGVRFAETDRVQPVEHARCMTWKAVAYLGADGRSVRPIPGEEEGYRKEYKQLSESVDVPVEPPAGSNPMEGAGDSC